MQIRRNHNRVWAETSKWPSAPAVKSPQQLRTYPRASAPHKPCRVRPGLPEAVDDGPAPLGRVIVIA
jgi:hypothetical protein